MGVWHGWSARGLGGVVVGVNVLKARTGDHWTCRPPPGGRNCGHGGHPAMSDPLLTPLTVAGVTIRNRIFSTSHTPGYAEDGLATDRYLLYHREKARGGIGLTMIGGSTNVAPDSPSIWGQLYAGDDAVDADKIAFLLRKLDNIPARDRTARFRCVIAVAWPGGPLELHSGACEGTIVEAPRGSNGFGYDPVFFIPAMGRTMAELSTAQKNRVSHRALATRDLAQALVQLAAKREK